MPPASRVLPFLLVFASLLLFALVLTIVSEFSDVKWVETIISIGEGLGRLTLAAIAITFISVEGIPMLAAWYKKEMRTKAREEGLVEGREEERKAWQVWRDEREEWGRQKAAADAAGVEFNEPRPPAPDEI